MGVDSIVRSKDESRDIFVIGLLFASIHGGDINGKLLFRTVFLSRAPDDGKVGFCHTSLSLAMLVQWFSCDFLGCKASLEHTSRTKYSSIFHEK